jgi:hypothetical protein
VCERECVYKILVCFCLCVCGYKNLGDSCTALGVDQGIYGHTELCMTN